MAEVLIAEESIDSALKRLKKAVGREGILRIIKQSHFNGAMTRSQRRRAKKMLAKSRYKKNHRGDDSGRGPDKEKLRLQDSPLYHDRDWATGEETWKPDLTPIKLSRLSEVERRPWSGFRTDPLHMFGEDKRTYFKKPEEDDIPSTHSCTIALYNLDGKLRFIVVRGLNDDKTERQNFQFPGGGKEDWEKTPEETAVREYFEETGLKILNPAIKDRIFTQVLGNHTFICYLGKIVGGQLCQGTEIVELQLVTYEQLCQMAEERMLSPKHEKGFLNFKAMVEAVQNRGQKEVVNV